MAKTKSITSEFTTQELWQLGCVVIRRIKDEEQLLEMNTSFGHSPVRAITFLSELHLLSKKITEQICDRQEVADLSRLQ